MECKFHIGQRVLCVGTFAGHYGRWSAYQDLPQQGETYTIRDVFVCPRTGDIAVRLKEIKNPQFHDAIAGWIEGGFVHTSFKPLETKKIDISIFTKMLQPDLEKV
jgi:hypothetical protein